MNMKRFFIKALIFLAAFSSLNPLSCKNAQEKEAVPGKDVDYNRILLTNSIEFDCTRSSTNGGRKQKKKEFIRKEKVTLFTIDDLTLDPGGRPNTIVVPPRTEYVMTLDSYCMKSNGAGPKQNELYKVIKVKDDDIIKKFLNGTWKKCLDKRNIQSIIWNITNRRHPRDLPESQQSILVEMGIVSREEVNVLPIEKIMFDFSSWIFGTLIVNTMENYNITETAIINRKSMYKLKTVTMPQYNHRPFLIKLHRTYSYSKIKIAFYNYTDRPRKLNITDYHLIPVRSDVQPLSMELSRKYSCR